MLTEGEGWGLVEKNIKGKGCQNKCTFSFTIFAMLAFFPLTEKEEEEERERGREGERNRVRDPIFLTQTGE